MIANQFFTLQKPLKTDNEGFQNVQLTEFKIDFQQHYFGILEAV